VNDSTGTPGTQGDTGMRGPAGSDGSTGATGPAGKTWFFVSTSSIHWRYRYFVILRPDINTNWKRSSLRTFES